MASPFTVIINLGAWRGWNNASAFRMDRESLSAKRCRDFCTFFLTPFEDSASLSCDYICPSRKESMFKEVCGGNASLSRPITGGSCVRIVASFSLIASFEDFIRPTTPLVQKRRHMRCALCARFLSVALFWPLIGRSPQLTSIGTSKTIPTPLNASPLPSTPLILFSSFLLYTLRFGTHKKCNPLVSESTLHPVGLTYSRHSTISNSRSPIERNNAYPHYYQVPIPSPQTV